MERGSDWTVGKFYVRHGYSRRIWRKTKMNGRYQKGGKYLLRWHSGNLISWIQNNKKHLFLVLFLKWKVLIDANAEKEFVNLVSQHSSCHHSAAPSSNRNWGMGNWIFQQLSRLIYPGLYKMIIQIIRHNHTKCCWTKWIKTW